MGYDWTDKRLCVFESVFLIDLSPTSAMIGWGRFPLRKAKSNPNLVTIVDRSEMRNPVEFVGEGALHTHDDAVVLSVRGPGRKLVGAPRTFWGGDKACARIDGLTPDTLYTYELTGVNSKRPFPSAGMSLTYVPREGLRVGAEPPPIQQFRTHPPVAKPTPEFRFLVVGVASGTELGAEPLPSVSPVRSAVRS